MGSSEDFRSVECSGPGRFGERSGKRRADWFAEQLIPDFFLLLFFVDQPQPMQVSAKVRREADRLVLALFAGENLSAPAFER